MGDLLWPGDHLAGDLLTDQALLDAMVRVEAAWVGGDLPPVRVDELDAGAVAASGNPVPALVALLRTRSGDDRVHRGLTSQDVVDTALVLCLRDAVTTVRGAVRRQVGALTALASTHRDTAVVARTLTQHAVPTTFGLRVAHWLTAVLDADDDLAALRFPVQVGGAAGTGAAALALGRDPAGARASTAAALGLDDAPPWHTTRRPTTRVGDALVAATDAWGYLAGDVLTLSRPEIGEVSEGAPGGSSTMPHKQNPVLSTLLRRAALTAPQLAATLHLAAADQVDERAVGGWHAEWVTVADLGRRTVVAAVQAADLLEGLVVHPDRMASTLAAAHDAVRAEQRSLTGGDDGDYLGESGALVDAVLARAAGRS